MIILKGQNRLGRRRGLETLAIWSPGHTYSSYKWCALNRTGLVVLCVYTPVEQSVVQLHVHFVI